MLPVVRHFILHNDSIDPYRLWLYGSLRWTLKTIPLKQLGVWDRAQGMPHKWCIGNVLDTARIFGRSKARGAFKEKIEALAEMAPDVVMDTIIVVDGRFRRGRENCKCNRYSIDDGCMRAVARAVRGFREIKAYIGK